MRLRVHGLSTPHRVPSFELFIDSRKILCVPRDLKPENLLLDDAFRIKITDFGTGKILDSGGTCLIVRRHLPFLNSLFDDVTSPGEPTKTFVGTAQYVSPELLEHNESSKR